MSNQLFGVKPWDHIMLAMAALMLGCGTAGVGDPGAARWRRGAMTG